VFAGCYVILFVYVIQPDERHEVKMEFVSLLPKTEVVQELESVHFVAGILLVVFRFKVLETLSIMTGTLK
jgi:hypothetical protein